jgi:hypothetical protein
LSAGPACVIVTPGPVNLVRAARRSGKPLGPNDDPGRANYLRIEEREFSGRAA